MSCPWSLPTFLTTLFLQEKSVLLISDTGYNFVSSWLYVRYIFSPCQHLYSIFGVNFVPSIYSLNMRVIRAIDIWNRIDSIRNTPLTDLCKAVGVPYARVKRNRTDCRIPSCEDLLALADGLDTTIDFLLTGNQIEAKYPPRIERIIERCMNADNEDLSLVERVLRIDSPSGEKSDTSSALA